MRRADAIAYMRVAGYHEDAATWTRLYIENRVSRAVANEAFRAGRAMKASGMACGCHECKTAKL